MSIRKLVFIIMPVLLILPAVFAEDQGTEKITVNYDNQKLLRGELQVFEHLYDVQGKGKKKRIIGVLLINAPQNAVWSIIEDWDSMSSFVPEVVYQKTKIILSSSGEKRETIIESKLNILMFLNVYYILQVRFDKLNFREDWSLIPDEKITEYNAAGFDLHNNTAGIKDIEGVEYLEPFNNGSGTIYFYSPVVETSIPVPGFIETALSKKSVADFMLSVKKKAESLTQAGK